VLPMASRAYTRCRAVQQLLVRCWPRFQIGENLWKFQLHFLEFLSDNEDEDTKAAYSTRSYGKSNDRHAAADRFNVSSNPSLAEQIEMA
jgi:hypothetical protein